MEIEEAAYKRRNVAMRQAPDNLTEQFSKVGGVVQGIKGGAKVIGSMVSGSPGLAASGALDVLEGAGMRMAAKYVKEMQTTDALIARAFKNYTQQPKPIIMPPPFQPRGLLGKGAYQMPPVQPPDPVPPQWANQRMYGNTGAKLLESPKGPIYPMGPGAPTNPPPPPDWATTRMQSNIGSKLLPKPDRYQMGEAGIPSMVTGSDWQMDLVPVRNAAGKIEWLPKWMTQQPIPPRVQPPGR